MFKLEPNSNIRTFLLWLCFRLRCWTVAILRFSIAFFLYNCILFPFTSVHSITCYRVLTAPYCTYIDLHNFTSKLVKSILLLMIKFSPFSWAIYFIFFTEDCVVIVFDVEYQLVHNVSDGNQTICWTLQSVSSLDELYLSAPELNLYKDQQLRIYDGASSDRPLIATLTGSNSNPPVIYASSDVIHVVLSSSSAPLETLLIDFRTVAHFSVMTPQVQIAVTADENRQWLTSPGYPSAYPPDQDVGWTVEGSSDCVIGLIVEALDTEPGMDYLLIFNGLPDDTLNRFVLELSGRGNPKQEFISTGSRVYVSFRSDGTTTGPGFRISYRPYYNNSSRDGNDISAARQQISLDWYFS